MKEIMVKDTTFLNNSGIIKFTKTLDLSNHYHRQIELLYLKKGKLDINISSKTLSINANDIAIIKSFELHNFVPKSKDNQYLLIILPDSISLRLANITSKVFHNIDNDIKKILNLYKVFSNMDKKYINMYYDLISKIINNLYHIPKINKNKSDIINYITNNFTSNLTLEKVAIACATNRSYVSKTINEQIGTNFKKYLNKLRIVKFLDLYIDNNSDSSIEKLATLSGFTNLRTFYRAFTEELGCSPTEYYKQKNINPL